MYACNLGSIYNTFWIMVLSKPRYKLQWVINLFELCTPNCLMCSALSSEVHGLPHGFYFKMLPLSLYCINQLWTVLWVEGSVPYICQKLYLTLTMDWNFEYHIMHSAFCWVDLIILWITTYHCNDCGGHVMTPSPWPIVHMQTKTGSVVQHFTMHPTMIWLKLNEILNLKT